MNIVFIVVDSLRSDHLGVNNYKRKTSPNIDKLAKEGIFFTTAIPTVARTTPSIVSILTGFYPHSSGVRLLTNKLNPSITTLQEILKAHGYRTIGHDIEMRGKGIEKGFDIFNPLSWRILNKIKRGIKKTINWSYKVDPAETLTNFGIKHLNKSKNEKFFLYLRYISLHWPYTSPKPYDDIFDPDYKGEHTFNEVNSKIKRRDVVFNNKLSKEEINHAIAHYDGSIRYEDFQIGRLLEHLENLNLTQDTLIILTADHGESFGEHDLYFNHGDYLYDEDLRVPLILSYSKLPKKIIENQVQLTDLFPTILEFLQIPLVDNIDGVNLMPLIKENKGVRKYTFAESGKSFFKENKRRYINGVRGKWRMIRSNNWKLIYIPHPKNDIYELYNIKEDAGENINLIDKRPDIADEFKKELFKWMKDPGDEKEINLTKKSKKMLRELGYME